MIDLNHPELRAASQGALKVLSGFKAKFNVENCSLDELKGILRASARTCEDIGYCIEWMEKREADPIEIDKYRIQHNAYRLRGAFLHLEILSLDQKAGADPRDVSPETYGKNWSYENGTVQGQLQLEGCA